MRSVVNSSLNFVVQPLVGGPLLDEYNVGSHPYIGFRLVLDAK